MTYNQNIPINTDYMVISQPQIQSNFQQINKIFNENHVILNQAIPGNSQGMHDLMTFRVQLDPVTTATQVCLYTKASGNDINLFFQPSNNQTPIQLTYPSISTGLVSTNPDVYLSRQYSFLPGPFVIYFGILSANDGDVITLTPSTTLLYVGLTMQPGLSTLKTGAAATNIAGNQFTVRYPSTSFQPQNVNYTAIGKP